MLNPSVLVMNIADYSAFQADGTTPRVTSVVVRVETPPGAAPIDHPLGKPAPEPDGVTVRQGIAGQPFFEQIPAFGGQSLWRVYTIGPGGVSALSNSVTVERDTPPATPQIGLE